MTQIMNLKMNQIALWENELNLCTNSVDDFFILAPEILLLLSKNDLKYSNFFYKAIPQLIVSKQYSPQSRFYSLYLLFKATEKGDLTNKGDLFKDHELMSFLYRAAGQDSQKFSFGDRGKKFFSISPTLEEMRIGINFVRLSLECLLCWKNNYPAKKLNSKSDALSFYLNLLQKEVKFPRFYHFIDRNYYLSQDLATWDFSKNNPKIINETVEDNANPQSEQLETSGIKVKEILKQMEESSLKIETEKSETESDETTIKFPIDIITIEKSISCQEPTPTLIPKLSNSPVSPFSGTVLSKCSSTPKSPMFRPKNYHPKKYNQTFSSELDKINKSIERSRENVYYWKQPSRSGTIEINETEGSNQTEEYGLKNLARSSTKETKEEKEIVQTKHRYNQSDMNVIQKINSYGQKSDQEVHTNIRRSREQRLKSLLIGCHINAK